MDNKQTIRERLLSRLQTRLIGIVVLITLVAGGLVSVTAIMVSRNTMREQIITSNLAAADLMAKFTAINIESAERNLFQLSTQPGFIRAVLENDLAQAEMRLEQFMKIDKRFDSVNVYTANGIGWASGLKDKWKNRRGTVADREWFQQTCALGKPYLGLPLISRGTGNPAAPYAIPIFNDKGKIHAVIIAGISLAELSNIIMNMRMSASSQANLLDMRQGGIYIVHSDPKRILKPIPAQIKTAQLTFKGEHGTMEILNSNSEGEFIVSSPVKGLPWSILIMTPVKTVYATLNTLIVQSALYTVILMLIASILGVLLTRTITRPVKQLVKGTEEIARGNLDHRIQVRRKDEIGLLADSFNAMAGDLAETKRENLRLFEELKSWSIELETRVEERTAELIQSNQSLRQSEEKFSKAFQTSPYAITITSTKDGKFIEVNDAFSSITGFTREEALANSSIGMSLWANQEDRTKVVSDLFEGKDVAGKEFLFRKKYDEIITGLFSAQVINLNNETYILSSINDISERKRAEEALQASDALLQAAINILPVGLWIIDAQGKIVTSSAAAQRIWAGVHYVGIDQLGEYKGWRTDSGKLIEPHEWAGARALKKGETSIEEEVEIECFDGTHKIILDSAVPLRKSDGSISGAITINQDITERKRAEEALALSEQFLNNVIEQSPESLWVSDSEGSMIRMNQACRKLFGVTDEEVVGKYNLFKDNLIEEQGFMPLIEDVFRKGEIARFTIDYNLPRVEHVKVSGAAHKILDVVISPFKDMYGKVTNAIVQHKDITLRKRAEEALRLANAYNRSLIEASLDPLVTIDRDGKIMDVNAATEKVTGYSRQGLVGKDFSDYFAEPEKARTGYQRVFKEGYVVDYPLEIRHKDGRIIPVLYNASVYRDERGKVIGVFAAARDITERKRAEEQIMQALADLERSNRDLEQFAYVASHDLQEPLRMVSSYTQLLAQRYEGQLDDKAKKYIDYAVDGAVRMQRLINDLLIYSRVSTQGKPPEPTDSHAVLGEVLRNLSVSIEESRAVVTNDELPVVRADSTQLPQVFQNLIANAIKFHAQALPHIHVSASDLGDEWCFSVKDNGIGIEPQHANKIFVIFQRLHNREEYPGTGIGLSICKRIIERHGGRIWFESEPGIGSTFYFTLKK